MKPPTATYRLQFRNGFDFDKAVPVARYLEGARRQPCLCLADLPGAVRLDAWL